MEFMDIVILMLVFVPAMLLADILKSAIKTIGNAAWIWVVKKFKATSDDIDMGVM